MIEVKAEVNELPVYVGIKPLLQRQVEHQNN